MITFPLIWNDAHSVWCTFCANRGLCCFQWGSGIRSLACGRYCYISSLSLLWRGYSVLIRTKEVFSGFPSFGVKSHFKKKAQKMHISLKQYLCNVWDFICLMSKTHLLMSKCSVREMVIHINVGFRPLSNLLYFLSGSVSVFLKHLLLCCFYAQSWYLYTHFIILRRSERSV